MITLFCSPRSFDDPHVSLIQRNAIQSWLALEPLPEVLLLGNDKGVREVAREFAVTHVPEVETDRYGVPLRSSMFKVARDASQYDLLCTINSDIIVASNLCQVVSSIPLSLFVGAGRRYDINIEYPMAFDESNWRSDLLDQVTRNGRLRGPSTIDYAVYPKNICPPILPPFAVNSPGWDPWFLFQHRIRNIPVVDLTWAVTVVHQNHATQEQVKLKRRAWKIDAEAMDSLHRAGGFSSMTTLREVDYVFGRSGMHQAPLTNRLFSWLAKKALYRDLLSRIRKKRMGYM